MLLELHVRISIVASISDKIIDRRNFVGIWTSEDLTGSPLKPGDNAEFFCVLDTTVVNGNVNSSNLSLRMEMNYYEGVLYSFFGSRGHEGTPVYLTDFFFKVCVLYCKMYSVRVITYLRGNAAQAHETQGGMDLWICPVYCYIICACAYDSTVTQANKIPFV